MQQEEIQFTTFHSTRDAGWREAWEIYTEAFPENERWSEDRYAEALANDPLLTADGILLDGKIVGIIFHWRTPCSEYIEHFAVSSDYRNRKLGARILEAMCKRYSSMILEIEEPVDELTRRRAAFYRRHGFIPSDRYGYIHPSYHKPFQEFPLKLVAYPTAPSWEEAVDVADFVRTHLLPRYSDHTDPTLPVALCAEVD